MCSMAIINLGTASWLCEDCTMKAELQPTTYVNQCQLVDVGHNSRHTVRRFFWDSRNLHCVSLALHL